MAAIRLIEQLERCAPGRYRITAIGAEPQGAYNRIALSQVLAGEAALGSIALPVDGARLVTGDPVAAIDRGPRQVRLASGAHLDYDLLVLATGSLPILLPLPGADLDGVHGFRDIADVQALIAAKASRAVVIGGGLLGLEAAAGLRRRGLEVSVVHLMPWLMERQLDADAAGLLQRALERRGLRFFLEAKAEAILGAGRVTGIRLEGGEELPADLVVMAVGVQPHIALARAAGLACKRGLVVDDRLQTVDPAIYGLGECVEHRGLTYGLVAPLYEQAEVLARHLGGDARAIYPGSVPATSLKVSGIDIHSAGRLSAEAGAEEIVLEDPGRGVYRRLVLRDDRLIGAVQVGDVTDGSWYLELIRSARRIGSVRDELIFGRAFVGDWAQDDMAPIAALEAAT